MTILLLWMIGGLPPIVAEEIEKTPPTTRPDETQERLSTKIQNYLSIQDPKKADALLHDLVTDPEVTISKVESLIKKGRTDYEQQPVGTLYGQPLLVRNHSFHFGLFVPPSYSPQKAYSLVVCLHGAGFSGDVYLERWSPRLGEGFILACPTLPQGTWWTRLAEEIVLGTIQTVVTRYRIDPDRIFLTGMSNGGIGAWLIGFHHVDRFAGLAPMASGIDNVLFPFLDNLRNTPVYMIHGKQDQVMPIRLSRTIAKRLESLGYPFIFREHNRSHPMAGGHFFPREELPALVEWLDQQRRTTFPKQLSLVRDATHFNAVSWIRIDATDRIAAFSENLIDNRDQRILNKEYAKLEAQIENRHHINITTERIQRLTVFLNHHLVDLTQPLTITVNGKERFSGNVHPTVETLLSEARKRQDPAQLYSVRVPISVME